MGDEEKLPGNFPVTARAGWMQPVLTKPASPSSSMSLSVGLERDKGGQRDLPGDQLESWASLQDQVGDSCLAGGSGRGAGTGEVREELTNGAGSTAGSCFARRGQIRGWQRSAPAAPVCLCKDPALAPAAGAGMPAWSPDTGTVPDADAGHILSAARAVSCHTGLAVHLRDPEPLGAAGHSARIAERPSRHGGNQPPPAGNPR
ncbi:unnamed protein product [Coccothraustes coccothraustes]